MRLIFCLQKNLRDQKPGDNKKKINANPSKEKEIGKTKIVCKDNN